jgi:O-antigen/teichoic acid export membrane protein
MRTNAVALASPPSTTPAVPVAATLTKRASLNAVQSLLDYAARLGVGLIVTPLLVSRLGRELFGVWEMLNRLIGYMSAADGRPTEALRLVIATKQAATDPMEHRRAVGSALVVWLLFSPLLAGLGSVLVWLSPLVTKVPPAMYTTVRVASAALLISLLLGGLSSVPESVLRGMNLGYKRMGFQAGLNVIGGLLTAGAIFAGFGLVGVAGAQVALVAITGVCFWILVKHYVTSFGVARPSVHDVRSLLGMSAWIAIGEVVAKLAIASDVIILGMIVSPALVTTYVLTGYAGRIALGLHVFTTGAAMPGLGGVIGRGEYEWAAGLRAEIMNLTWLFVTAVGATILLWNRSFLTLWVGPENYAGFWTNLLVVIATAQTALVRTDAYVLDATLQPRLRVWVAAVAGVAIVGFSIALTPSLGIVGVCLGVLMGRLVQTIAYPLLVDRCLHRPARLRVRSIARPLTVMLVMFGATATVGERVLARHWLGWAVGVALSLAIMMAVAFVAGLPAEARGTVLGRLRTMLATARG